jgi:hypothetical protein
VVESFRARHGEINCFEITEIDRSSSTWQMINYFLIKGGTVGCFRMASWYAPLAFQEIDSALSEEVTDAPSPPVSCASTLARSLGVSDMHAVMASGLAGGIGLCGGACGALGAALWILGMGFAEEEGGKVGFRDPRFEKLVERFLEHTGYRFECAEIVGQRFESVPDHADYLRGGGCSELLALLAEDAEAGEE